MGAGVSASFGGPNELTTTQFAIMQRHAGAIFGHVDGCAVTTGGGTRQVVVAPGTVWLPGTYHTVSGITLNLPENTSGQPRRDSIVLVYDWNANSASITYRAGTPAASPQAPALTRLVGDLFQVELAEVPVAAGQTTLSSVWDRRPGVWIPIQPSSPWSNYGGTWEPLGIRQRADGDMELRGLIITSSTITSPSTQPIQTLESPRWRPAMNGIYTVHTREGNGAHTSGRVDVYPNGVILVRYPATTTGTRYLSLNGITWTPSELEA